MVPVALADLRVSVNAKLVFVWLCRYANRDGLCWPSVGRLATESGVDRSTVNRALAELMAAKVLRKESGKDVGRTNRYLIVKWWGDAQDATPPVGPTDVEQKQGGYLGELLPGGAQDATRVGRTAPPGKALSARGGAQGATQVFPGRRSNEVGDSTSAAPTPHQRIMAAFNEAFFAKCGFPPTLGKTAGAMLKDTLSRRSEGEILEVLRTWFSTSDPWPAKVGYKMPAMLSSFDAVKLMARDVDRVKIDPTTEGALRRFVERGGRG